MRSLDLGVLRGQEVRLERRLNREFRDCLDGGQVRVSITVEPAPPDSRCSHASPRSRKQPESLLSAEDRRWPSLLDYWGKKDARVKALLEKVRNAGGALPVGRDDNQDFLAVRSAGQRMQHDRGGLYQLKVGVNCAAVVCLEQ